MGKKTSCPITREQFKKAQPVTVKIGDQEFQVEPREFGTGSLGWYLNAKTTLTVDGVRVPVQIGLNLTIVGSKELPQATDGAARPAPARATRRPAPRPRDPAGSWRCQDMTRSRACTLRHGASPSPEG